MQETLDRLFGTSPAERERLHAGRWTPDLERYFVAPPRDLRRLWLAATVGMVFATLALTGAKWALAAGLGLASVLGPAVTWWRVRRRERKAREAAFGAPPPLRALEDAVETTRVWAAGPGGAWHLRAALTLGSGERVTLPAAFGDHVVSGRARVFVLAVPAPLIAGTVQWPVALEALPDTRLERRPPARPAPSEPATASAPAD
jgi:hypothetical protein